MSQKLVLSRFKALDRWSGFSILPPIIVFTMVPIGESILTIMIMIITITIMITMIIVDMTQILEKYHILDKYTDNYFLGTVLIRIMQAFSSFGTGPCHYHVDLRIFLKHMINWHFDHAISGCLEHLRLSEAM